MKNLLLILSLFIGVQSLSAQDSTFFTIDTIDSKIRGSVTHVSGDTVIYMITQPSESIGDERDLRIWIRDKIEEIRLSMSEYQEAEGDEIDAIDRRLTRLIDARDRIVNDINQLREKRSAKRAGAKMNRDLIVELRSAIQSLK